MARISLADHVSLIYVWEGESDIMSARSFKGFLETGSRDITVEKMEVGKGEKTERKQN